MKRLSTLLTLMVLAITATTFTSCDEKTYNYPQDIIGTWVEVDSEDFDEERLTFNADLTGSLTEIDEGLETVLPFKYQVLNDKVSLEYYLVPGVVFARESFFIRSMTATEMTISDGYGDIEVWHRASNIPQ